MVKTLPLKQALKILKLPGLYRNLFSSEGWLSVIDKTYNLELFVKYIEREGGIDSYIIYSVVKNFLEWKICMCSYCDYFDCHVKSVEDWDLFFKALREEYPGYRITVRNLKDEHVRAYPNFKILSKERFHFLDIKDDLDSVWKRAHDSFKSAVRQAEKKGVVIKPCTKEVLPQFYQLHLKMRKNKYRIFPQPYRFFKNIWEQYIDKDQGVLLGAYDPQGRFIAGNMYLICSNTLYYKFNTSSLDALKFRPNNLMFWEGVKYAKQKGLDYIDLGSSGYDQHGLILFKNHTGAQCIDITHLGFAPKGYKFSQKRILKIMTRTFTLPFMPDFMLKIGSNIIYPFLA
jgi:hypothetical protein